MPVQLRFVIRGQQEAYKHERLEPDDVGEEPVVYSELEGDDECRREGGEPAQRLLARHEGDEYGQEDDDRRHGPLQESELWDLGIDRPWADPVALEGEGLLVEELGSLEGSSVQQDDPEREQ